MSSDSDLHPDAAGTSLLERAVFALVRGCGWLSALLILLVVAIIAFAIARRYLLDDPLLWGDELLGYLLVAMVMLGAGEALRRQDHIAMDLFTAEANPRVRRLLGVWSSLAVLLLSAVIGISTWESIQFSISFGAYSTGYIEIETWIPQLPMLLGSALLGLTALAQLLRQLWRGNPA
jgi:TRAP-type C4-dicarboxylate transport system permease small subunit